MFRGEQTFLGNPTLFLLWLTIGLALQSNEGTCTTNSGGKLASVKEKPFLVLLSHFPP